MSMQDYERSGALTHEWAPTDTQGHCMECIHCGKYVSVYGPESSEEWDYITVHEECPKRKEVKR